MAAASLSSIKASKHKIFVHPLDHLQTHVTVVNHKLFEGFGTAKDAREKAIEILARVRAQKKDEEGDS